MHKQDALIYRFGVFELDVRAAELRKSGMKLRLQDQPYQILLKLLQQHGELVSREELRAALWHEDTFVDFETGLNTAIKRLRDTLGDSADSPRFIETIPRRGYKFIAPVEGPATKGSGMPGLGKAQKPAAGRNLFTRAVFIAGIAFVIVTSVFLWRSIPQLPTVNRIVRITSDGKAKDPLNPPVTDGVHLYFTEGTPHTSGAGIAQVSTAGGETSWIPTPLEEVMAVSSVSPDRSELLVARNGLELWAQPLPAGAPHRVGDIKTLLANWTPDGTQVVYADWQAKAIMIAKKDGSDAHVLAKVPGIVFSIRFSPDGKRIRFDLTDPKTDSNAIWEMDANGQGMHPLLPDWRESSYYCCGNWSPDGKYYYFLAGREESQSIWVMPEAHSVFRRSAKTPSRLTSGPIRFWAPVPSGDGKRLFVLGEQPRVELLRYDLKAGRFDPYLPGVSAGPVDFSYDGRWLTYVLYPEMTLWRSKLDGSDKMQLTFPPVRAYGPRWSPDGSQIAFMDVQFEHAWKIDMVAASGGSPEVLREANVNLGDPTWVPDGKSIVFAEWDKMGGGAIHRLDLKSREVSSIGGSDGLYSSRVSPDGRYISAVTTLQTKLMLFDTITKQWSTLAEGDEVGYNEWSRDGKYIYMRENRDGAGELVRVRVKDRVLEHVISLKNFPQLSDHFAQWIGLTPDNAPLLMRDRSVQEIYALDLQFH